MLRRTLILSCGVAAFTLSATTATAFSGTSSANTPQSHITYITASSIETNAQNFIEKLSSEGIGFLQNKDLSTEKREKAFRDLLKNNFDMKTIGRFALGRYWKTSTKKEQKEYLNLFENMIVEVYSRRFSEYNGEALNIVSTRPQGKADVLVSSVIIPESGAKVSVDWRVRKKKNGKLKVIDIMVEGVSMSLTQRSDFASVIQRGGGKIDVLLAHLRQD